MLPWKSPIRLLIDWFQIKRIENDHTIILEMHDDDDDNGFKFWL